MGQTPSYNRTCSKSTSILINATPREVREQILYFSGVEEWGRAYIKHIEILFHGENALSKNGYDIDVPYPGAILKIVTADGKDYHVTVKENSTNTLRWEGAPREILDDEFKLIGKHQFTYFDAGDGKTRFEQTLAYDERYHEGPKYGCTNEQWEFIQNEDTKKMEAFNEEFKNKLEGKKAADAAFWKQVYSNR